MKDKYFEIFEFNNKKYILIDTFLFHEKEVYYFATMEDELFCYKEKDQYIPIQDKYTIDLIRNLCGLIKSRRIYNSKNKRTQPKKKILKSSHTDQHIEYKSSYKDISPEILKAIREEQKENFRKIQQRFELDINLEEIERRIDEIPVTTYENDYEGSSGYYNPLNDSIHLKQEITHSQKKLAKKTILHEYIHAMTGIRCLGYERGLIEGQTENLASDFFDEGKSCYESGDAEYQRNFDETTSYPESVTIVKQMEYVLGMNSYESILKGDLSFENKFKEKYGDEIFTRLAKKTNLMIKMSKEKNIDFIKFVTETQNTIYEYLQEIQNELLEVVFDKDFQDIKNREDAEEYFEKLKGFETVRQRKFTKKNISKSDLSADKFANLSNSTTIEDPFFEEYYLEKLQRAKDMLISKGEEESTINLFLDQYKYERQSFKPSAKTKYTEKEVVMRECFISATNCLYENLKNEDTVDSSLLDVNNYEISFAKDPKYDNYYYLFYNKINGEKMLYYIDDIVGFERYENQKEYDYIIEKIQNKGFEFENLEISQSQFIEGLYKELKFDEEYAIKSINDSKNSSLEGSSEKIKKYQEDLKNIKIILSMVSETGLIQENKESSSEKDEKLSKETSLIVQKDNVFTKFVKAIKSFIYKTKITNKGTSGIELKQPNNSQNDTEEKLPPWDLKNYGTSPEEITAKLKEQNTKKQNENAKTDNYNKESQDITNKPNSGDR